MTEEERPPTLLEFAVQQWFGIRTMGELFAALWRQFRDDQRRLAAGIRADLRAARLRRLAELRQELRKRQNQWIRVRSAAGGGVLARRAVWARLRRLAWQDVRRYDAMERAAVIPVAVVVLLVFALPTVPLTMAGVEWYAQFAAIAMATVMGVMPFLALALWLRAQLWLPFLAVTLLGAALAAVPGGLSFTPVRSFVMVLQVAFVQWVVLVALGAGCVLGYLAVRSWLARRRPDIEAAVRLAWLLDLLYERDLADARERRAVARVLDDLAAIVEHGYARALRLPGADVNAEVRGRLRRIAAGIRSQQVAVALPDADTVAALRLRLLACAGAVATGRLGVLGEVFDAEPRPVRRRVLAALAFLRSLVVALVPGAVVLALHRQGLLPWDELGRGAAAVAAVWAVAVLLMALVPQFAPRVQGVKELLGMLRGGPKA